MGEFRHTFYTQKEDPGMDSVTLEIQPASIFCQVGGPELHHDFLVEVKIILQKKPPFILKVADFQGNGYIGQYGVIFEEQLLEYSLIQWLFLAPLIAGR